MSQKKLLEIKALIEGAEMSLQQAREMLASLAGVEDRSLMKKAEIQGGASVGDEGQIIEGVFDGQNMIGPDGKQYSVPANYASKSKLVEGDLLKLTIDNRGNFIYKQIGPIERLRIKGTLSRDAKTDEWRVLADGKAYRVLLASVTYFKGEQNDEVVIMVPKDKSSTWAAVENVIKNPAPGPDPMTDGAQAEQGERVYQQTEQGYEHEQQETPAEQTADTGSDDDIAPLGQSDDFEKI